METCLDMTDSWDKDVRLMGRNHETFCDTTINLKQARVKGTLRKKLSKADLAHVHTKLMKYLRSHPKNVGTCTVYFDKNGEMRVETDRS